MNPVIHSKVVVTRKQQATVVQCIGPFTALAVVATDTPYIGKKVIQSLQNIAFKDLPLLTCFAINRDKHTVLGQKTSNRTYVTLHDLKMDRSKKDMLVAPIDYTCELHDFSRIEAFDPKAVAQSAKMQKAEAAVAKAEKTLADRKGMLQKLAEPAAVVVKAGVKAAQSAKAADQKPSKAKTNAKS